MDYNTAHREAIKRAQDFLKDHPIDPKYDEDAECLDAHIPADQLAARSCRHFLKEAGEI